MPESMPAEGPVPRRKRGRPRLDAEMVPRILDAAEHLLSSGSPSSVSIRDIAAEANLPHSAIYRYFDSKDEIIAGVIQRGRERQWRRDSEAQAAGDPVANSIDWLMTENRAVVKSLVQLALEGKTPRSLGLESDLTQPVVDLMESRRLDFHVRTVDPRVTAAALTALSFGWAAAEAWVVEASGLSDLPIGEVRRQLEKVYETLLATAQGACDAAEPE